MSLSNAENSGFAWSNQPHNADDGGETAHATGDHDRLGSDDSRPGDVGFRVGTPGVIRYEFTVDDPATYTRPWRVALDLTTKRGYSMIYEYACHEGNYGLANMLSAARADERK